MSLPIEVHARTERQGKLVPVSCVIKGTRYQIFGAGRRWEEDDGEHLMVMFPGARAVELLHALDGTWALVKDHSNLADRLA